MLTFYKIRTYHQSGRVRNTIACGIILISFLLFSGFSSFMFAYLMAEPVNPDSHHTLVNSNSSVQSADRYKAVINPDQPLIEVGIAATDVTPDQPLRLAGYGSRNQESEGVLQPLFAKAIAFGNDEEGASLFITVDLIGIPWHVTREVTRQLAGLRGINPDHVVINASHTHTGPEVGNLLNHFGEPLPAGQLVKIALYMEVLTNELVQVSLNALDNRKPARIDIGEGEAGFAMNRRVLENGRWTGFGVVPDGRVDHSLPMLRITGPDGSLRAILVNYACHGTTLGGDINRIHGDWPGEVQRIIEERHPGVTAMVAIGAGADANPEPRGRLEYTTLHATEIADEVDRLLAGELRPVHAAPTGVQVEIELPYAQVPGRQELAEQSEARGARGYFARLALERILRGDEIPAGHSYPIQVWNFGDDLAMVFLAGEVVVDYAFALRELLDPERLWITAYANDVPGYIPSRRILLEGGYEADHSMYSYDHPSPYSPEVEELILQAVMELAPPQFRMQ